MMADPLTRLVSALEAQTAALERIADAMETATGQPDTPPDPLLIALAATFAGRSFTSAEAMAAAVHQAEAAETSGQRLPALPAALGQANITNAHALGRWLAARDGDGVSRLGVERGGAFWAIDAVLKPRRLTYRDET